MSVPFNLTLQLDSNNYCPTVVQTQVNEDVKLNIQILENSVVKTSYTGLSIEFCAIVKDTSGTKHKLEITSGLTAGSDGTITISPSSLTAVAGIGTGEVYLKDSDGKYAISNPFRIAIRETNKDDVGNALADTATTYDELLEMLTAYKAGDIGSDVEVVDNLTTDDATKALSAKQGKNLNSELNLIANAFGGFTSTSTSEISYNVFDKNDPDVKLGQYLQNDGSTLYAETTGGITGYIPCTNGDVVRRFYNGILTPYGQTTFFLYNSSKAFIAAPICASGNTYTIPSTSGIAYFRFWVDKDRVDTFGVTINHETLTGTGAVIGTSIDIDGHIEDKISEVISGTSTMPTFTGIVSNNVFDKNDPDFKLGLTANDGVNYTTSPGGYSTSGFIPCNNSDIIRLFVNGTIQTVFEAYLYNAEKEFLVKVYGESGSYVISNANAKYFKIETLTTDIDNTAVTLNSTELSDNETITMSLSDKVNLMDTDIMNLKNDISNNSDISIDTSDIIGVYGGNLFTGENISGGELLSTTDGTLTDNSSYNTSDFMEIPYTYNAPMKYLLAMSGNTFGYGMKAVAFYTSSKAFISGNSDITAILTIPSTAKYFRVSYSTTAVNIYTGVQNNTEVPTYSPYRERIKADLLPMHQFTSISDGALNMMLGTAMQYADNSNFKYGSEKNGFMDDCSADTDGKYQIDCSAFVQLVLMGCVPKCSRYYTDDNTPSKYGYKFNNTAKYETVTETNHTLQTGNHERLRANKIGQYAFENGYMYRIDKKDWSNIREGDVLFWCNQGTSDNAWENIGHCGIVSQVYRTTDNKINCMTFESLETTPTVAERVLTPSDSRDATLIYGARFPIPCQNYIPRVMYETDTSENISISSTTAGTYKTLKTITLDKNLKAGHIYTIVFKATSDKTAYFDCDYNKVTMSGVKRRADGVNVLFLTIPQTTTFTDSTKNKLTLKIATTEAQTTVSVDLDWVKVYEGHVSLSEGSLY